jgi:hypothetical protein
MRRTAYLMVRSARERASRTMGGRHRSRPRPVLRDGASRLLRTRMRGVGGRIPCKQQRIYKHFTSMAARSVATGPSPNEKSRPAAARVVAFICGATARDMSLSCNGPARWVPGAIPTVDFLLYRFGAIVKKMAVKSHDGIRRRIQHVARMEPSSLAFGKPKDRLREIQGAVGRAILGRGCGYLPIHCLR